MLRVLMVAAPRSKNGLRVFHLQNTVREKNDRDAHICCAANEKQSWGLRCVANSRFSRDLQERAFWSLRPDRRANSGSEGVVPRSQYNFLLSSSLPQAGPSHPTYCCLLLFESFSTHEFDEGLAMFSVLGVFLEGMFLEFGVVVL